MSRDEFHALTEIVEWLWGTTKAVPAASFIPSCFTFQLWYATVSRHVGHMKIYLLWSWGMPVNFNKRVCGRINMMLLLLGFVLKVRAFMFSLTPCSKSSVQYCLHLNFDSFWHLVLQLATKKGSRQINPSYTFFFFYPACFSCAPVSQKAQRLYFLSSRNMPHLYLMFYWFCLHSICL